jgi:manganese/zinc/iron transport system permease protein
MFAGAAVAGVATVVLVELVKRLGRVEPGAAMGVVFSVLFALGVLLIEQAAARPGGPGRGLRAARAARDPALVRRARALGGLLSRSTLGAVPRQVWTLAGMGALAFAFVGLLFKELRIAAFDPALATTQGFNADGAALPADGVRRGRRSRASRRSGRSW